MSPQDAYECAKDFGRAFPRAMKGEFGSVVAGECKLATPGRLFLEALIPARITRQQFEVMLREVAATETNWSKAKVRLIAMAREASRQVWRQETQSPEAVLAAPRADQVRAADDGSERFAGGDVPHRRGETAMQFARRLLTEHRDKLSNEELENVEAFVRSRERHLQARGSKEVSRE